MIDPKVFVAELANRIATELRLRAAEFTEHRLGAVAIDTHPWHQGSLLSVLIEADSVRKWYIGDWEHQEFAILDFPMLDHAYVELKNEAATGSAAYMPFFRCCAAALCHPEVAEALLQLYTLEADFELYVGDPDDPNEVNICEEFTGVDRKRRKAKTEIVNNLDEAMKDPESVRTLKFWYQDGFTQRDNERIAQMKNLEVLNLSSMGLTMLPSCVLSLRQLTALELDGNSIASLDGIGSLRRLVLLSIRDNGKLTSEMAHAIAEIDSLRQLRIGGCNLAEVPEAFQRMQNLEELYVFNNPLKTISDWLLKMPRLKRLGLVDTADEATKDAYRKKYPHLEIW